MFAGLEQPTHLLILLVILLLIFGGRKIPELAKGLGQGVREFREGMNSAESEDEKEKKPKAVRAAEEGVKAAREELRDEESGERPRDPERSERR
ncbi:MAG: twin-arginine translocase TatA/TatE family subunit [Rubrobacteraceae bacterium]|uniref:Sec-independent protein translocase subunit TatA/TatB n=1 Tax=Rubrobacter naiadicus TaxID=1392641 RepID=UPI00235F6E87|nr:twin-arginine translocase TatA/TatE family subunit [Rubrobacter naiadicus]MBX6762589.1 twin-arginine translocase TatA/TatE family subunit [Rubrobacteraceae bacterium]MCL6438293.1 twin-arginine translocase TatA/TatE family subunit [Rubrobacteraceae bacterium]